MSVILAILIVCLVIWRLYVICKMIWTYDFFIGLRNLVLAWLIGREVFIAYVLFSQYKISHVLPFVAKRFIIIFLIAIVLIYLSRIILRKLSLKRLRVNRGYGVGGAIVLFIIISIVDFFSKNSFVRDNFEYHILFWLPVLLVAVFSRYANVPCAVLVNICLLGLLAFNYNNTNGSDMSFDDGMAFDTSDMSDSVGYIAPTPIDTAPDFADSMASNVTNTVNSFSMPINDSGMQTYMKGDGSFQSVMVNSVGDTTTISDLSGGVITCLSDGTILNSLGIADGRIDMSNMSNIKMFDVNNQLAFTMENNVIFDKFHQVAYTIQDGTLFDINHKLVAKLMS